MQPISCARISFAISVIGVSGLTQSTPLCIASLTFMADLRCCDFRWYSRDAEQLPLGSTIRRIGQDGIAKGVTTYQNSRIASLCDGISTGYNAGLRKSR